MKIIKVTNVCDLNEFVIKREFRRRGIDSKAMEFAERFSIALNCHKIRVKTCPVPAAYALYKKHGFIEEAWLKNEYLGGIGLFFLSL